MLACKYKSVGEFIREGAGTSATDLSLEMPHSRMNSLPQFPQSRRTGFSREGVGTFAKFSSSEIPLSRLKPVLQDQASRQQNLPQ